MALVGGGYFGVVELIDNGGNVTKRRFELTAATVTAANTDMSGTIVPALVAVTDAVVKGYVVEETMVEDSLTLPASGIEIENLALLDLSVVGHPEKTATLTIPAPKPAIFVATSGDGANIVNTSNAAVAAYAALFGASGKALISDGEVSGGLTSGKRIHRKSNRG